MKFEGQRPSGKDKDIPVYNFVFGQEELRAIHEALVYFQKHCPQIWETHPIRARIKTMIYTIREFSAEHQIAVKGFRPKIEEKEH